MEADESTNDKQAARTGHVFRAVDSGLAAREKAWGVFRIIEDLLNVMVFGKV